MSINMLATVCGPCGELTGDYTRPASQWIIKSGELLLRTWLCDTCAGKADCAVPAPSFLRQSSVPPDDIRGDQINKDKDQ